MKAKLITLMILALLMPLGYAYAWDSNDSADRLSNGSSNTFSPGYINAAKQQAYNIVNQNNQPKGWWENLVDKIKNKTTSEVKEDASTKVQPEVKKKTSAKISSQTYVETEKNTIINLGSAGYMFKFFADYGKDTVSFNDGNTLLIQKTPEGKYLISALNREGSVIMSPVEFTGSGEPRDFESYFSGAYESVNISNGNIESLDIRLMDREVAQYYNADNKAFLDNSEITLNNIHMDQWMLYEGDRIRLYNLYFQANWETALASAYTDYYANEMWKTHDAGYDYTNLAFEYADSVANESIKPYSADYSLRDALEIYNSLSSRYNDGYTRVTSQQDIIETPFTKTMFSQIDNSLKINSAASSSSSNPYNIQNTSDLSYKSNLGIGDIKMGPGSWGLEKAFSQAILNQATLSPQPMLVRYAPESNTSILLRNIISNPTADQKEVLDATQALISDIAKIAEAMGDMDPELSKVENDLLQMVASFLLAQGVPDLLKAGDIEGVKGIFKDLGTSKDKLMMGYAQSIKPYYENIVKELSANLAVLQLKGILSKKLTEEELKNLEPKEITKILESIRKANDKTFELEYILQQDAKYRKEYLDPKNKALADNMKLMLNGFTQKLNKALEDKR